MKLESQSRAFLVFKKYNLILSGRINLYLSNLSKNCIPCSADYTSKNISSLERNCINTISTLHFLFHKTHFLPPKKTIQKWIKKSINKMYIKSSVEMHQENKFINAQACYRQDLHGSINQTLHWQGKRSIFRSLSSLGIHSRAARRRSVRSENHRGCVSACCQVPSGMKISKVHHC